MSDSIKAKRKTVRLASVYQELFRSQHGQEVLLHLIKNNFVLKSTIHENPNVSAYYQGRRDAVLDILTMMKVDHSKLMDELEKMEKMEVQDV